MKNVVVNLKMELHTKNPYDAEVVSILRSFSTAAKRKEFLVSAMLYYNKSPSFQVESSLMDLTDKLKDQIVTLREAPVSQPMTLDIGSLLQGLVPAKSIQSIEPPKGAGLVDEVTEPSDVKPIQKSLKDQFKL